MNASTQRKFEPSTRLTTEDYWAVLGAVGPTRHTSRGSTRRGRCPAHKDSHPSCDITKTGGGTTLFHCWAGCSQREIIEALAARGLWNQRHQWSTAPLPPFRWEEHISPEPPQIAACCCRGPENGHAQCEHWSRFDIDVTLGHLRARLIEAKGEIVQLYRTTQLPLDAKLLREELNLAVELGGGAIVPFHLDPSIIETAVNFVVTEALVEVAA